MRRVLSPLAVLLGVCLAACGALLPGEHATSVPVLTRLPTVTMQPATTATLEPPATIVPAPTTAPSATPTNPAVILTADGPVTASMARLKLSAEPYAAMGDPAAPITIVEFSDYGCPFCRLYALATFPRLKADYIDTGKVYYVYKHLPLVSRQGEMAAQAAECAGEQGGFWDMHNQLFIDPAEWNGSDEQARAAFRRYADALALDATALEACLVSERHTAQVARDFNEAQALRLSGTPAFFINGKLLIGAQPIEVFVEVLDAELAGQPTG